MNVEGIYSSNECRGRVVAAINGRAVAEMNGRFERQDKGLSGGCNDVGPGDGDIKQEGGQ